MGVGGTECGLVKEGSSDEAGRGVHDPSEAVSGKLQVLALSTCSAGASLCLVLRSKGGHQCTAAGQGLVFALCTKTQDNAAFKIFFLIFLYLI